MKECTHVWKMHPDLTMKCCYCGKAKEIVPGLRALHLPPPPKPWEETWLAEYGSLYAVLRPKKDPDEDGEGGDMGEYERFLDIFGGSDSVNEARLQLAACAPEAIRLLLDAEWADGGEIDPCSCPWCKGGRPTHAADCRLVALLKKAGVR